MNGSYVVLHSCASLDLIWRYDLDRQATNCEYTVLTRR